MMRAARFAITLGDGWRIDPDTESAIKANSSLLEKFLGNVSMMNSLKLLCRLVPPKVLNYYAI